MPVATRVILPLNAAAADRLRNRHRPSNYLGASHATSWFADIRAKCASTSSRKPGTNRSEPDRLVVGSPPRRVQTGVSRPARTPPGVRRARGRATSKHPGSSFRWHRPTPPSATCHPDELVDSAHDPPAGVSRREPSHSDIRVLTALPTSFQRFLAGPQTSSAGSVQPGSNPCRRSASWMTRCDNFAAFQPHRGGACDADCGAPFMVGTASIAQPRPRTPSVQ